MKQYYYISTPISPDNFAGTKARSDIEALAEQRGMQRIVFRGSNTANRNLIERMRLVWHGVLNWVCLERTVSPNSLVLFQYPHYPMKSAVLARYMMQRIQQKKQVRFIALVHDLNSVRKTFGKAAVYSDAQFLRQFDCVICHNARMREYLIAQGFLADRLVSLGVFDYLTDAVTDLPDGGYTPSVNIAGNLSREKSAYLYDLISSDLHYRIFLYGSGLNLPNGNAFVQHEGFAPAEALPGLLRGAFGLVWDGDSLATCSGDYGAYLAMNNPHKLSLYLCAGIPVIIWSGAALAAYITQNGLGFSVDSLHEIGAKLHSIDEQTYRSMRKNAAVESARIRGGYYFNQAVDQAEQICFAD